MKASAIDFQEEVEALEDGQNLSRKERMQGSGMEAPPMDIQGKVEALEDELNLLKNEMKQSLVDLREIVMKSRSPFLQSYVNIDGESASGNNHHGQRSDQTEDGRQDHLDMQGHFFAGVAQDIVTLGSQLRMAALDWASNGGAMLDGAMLGNFIVWLGTVKGRGMSLQRIVPYLETYERAGYITPAIAKLMLLSMADLDQMEDLSSRQAFSFQDYSECLRELHDIICTPRFKAIDSGAVEQSG